MKKYIIFCLAVFGINMASAQYYFTTYGGPDWEIAAAGCGVKSTQGYMLVGSHFTSGGTTELNVVWTDLNGDLSGAPYLNKSFTAIDAVTGDVYPAYATDVLESQVNSNFYIVGRVHMPSSDAHPFLLVMDPAGNVVSFVMYDFAHTWDMDKITITHTTDLSGDMYIAAFDYNQAGGYYSIMAERVDAMGNIIWGGIYDIINPNGVIQSTYSRDIIESPYPSQSGNPEIYVFGASYSPSSLTSNPVVLIIDGVTGMLQPVPGFEYDFGTDAEFSGVTLSNATAGFAVAGWYRAGANDLDALITNLDPSGAVNWASYHDNTVAPGFSNMARAIRERFNFSNQYEYYTAGEVFTGSGPQMQVLKLDAAGNVVPAGEFSVSSGSGYDNGVDLEFDPNGDGLAVFGNTMQSMGQIDMLTAKMYFNGVMPCNINTANLGSNQVTPAVNVLLTSQVFNPTLHPLISNDQSWNYNQVCFAPSVGGGSNNRVSANGNGTGLEDQPGSLRIAQLAGNKIIIDEPGETGSRKMQETGSQSLLGIRLYDMAGKEVYAAKVTSVNGAVSIDLTPLGLREGIYMLAVEKGGNTRVKKVLIH